jgi:hypothetical protein
MSDDIFDAASRQAIIDALLQRLYDHYILPNQIPQIETSLRERLKTGIYDQCLTPSAFCDLLSQHLQEISHDKHLRLQFIHQPQAAVQPPPPHAIPTDRFATFLRLRNFGFQKVERLAGQVGYIDLRGFAPPSLAGDLAVAAMTLVAHTEALMFDLRYCRGGDAGMVALLSSYLFSQPVHLNSMHWRDGDRLRQYWTAPYVPGTRYSDHPVYILTSARTFSAAEEFAYNLQQLKRATIVGEITGGGAHPTERFPLTPHIIAHIPIARSVNPISGTNWEISGVQPDIVVTAEQAFVTAHRLALTSILQRYTDAANESYADLLNEAREALTAIEPKA